MPAKVIFNRNTLLVL